MVPHRKRRAATTTPGRSPQDTEVVSGLKVRQARPEEWTRQQPGELEPGPLPLPAKLVSPGPSRQPLHLLKSVVLRHWSKAERRRPDPRPWPQSRTKCSPSRASRCSGGDSSFGFWTSLYWCAYVDGHGRERPPSGLETRRPKLAAVTHRSPTHTSATAHRKVSFEANIYWTNKRNYCPGSGSE